MSVPFFSGSLCRCQQDDLGVSRAADFMADTSDEVRVRASDRTVRSGWWEHIVHATPWKINMEHIDHPFREENDLPNLYDYVPC